MFFSGSFIGKISPNHLVRVVNYIVDALDISYLLSAYNGGGTNSYHPRMILKGPVLCLSEQYLFLPQNPKGLAEEYSHHVVVR